MCMIAERVGARHRVLHERGGQELAGLRLVDDLLHQRLPHALRDAAVDLALERDGIDDGADVVDDHVATSVTTPVSGSISTSQTWQPLGHVSCFGENVPVS